MTDIKKEVGSSYSPILKLELGHIVVTPGALKALAESGDNAGTFLARHSKGDWGDLTEEDQKENEFSLEHGFRLLSSYKLRNGTVICVITEADRASTYLVLPNEYLALNLALQEAYDQPFSEIEPRSIHRDVRDDGRDCWLSPR